MPLNDMNGTLPGRAVQIYAALALTYLLWEYGHLTLQYWMDALYSIDTRQIFKVVF
jgi:hypothetical protein